MQYEIIRTRRKTIALVIKLDGSLVVRAPLHATRGAISKVVAEHSDWIAEKQAEFKANPRQTVQHAYTEGEEFLYLGKTYPLTLVTNSRPALALDGRFKLTKTAQPKAAQVFERWYRQQAVEVFNERVQFFAHKHGFTYKGVRISSARTRWGSCSGHGMLSFTWRLVMAPLPVIDYVVLHELAHLEIRNHSKLFWQRVAQLIPEYKQAVSWLKENGRLLKLE